MCVIILRSPNISIPFEKIKSACIVNGDGWGFAIADRGKLEYTHLLEKDNDPEKVYKILEDAKAQPLLLHLRFTTQGKRSLENCHPFKTLTRDKHGVDIAFCHNGTLSEWKEDANDLSDSYWLNEKLVRPLLLRSAAYVGPDETLKDEFSQAMLEEAAGYSSLFGLIDGNGLQLAINHSKGKEFEGWWASNEYSFNTNHREPKTTTTTSFTNLEQYGTPWWEDDAYKEYMDDNQDVTTAGSCKTVETGKTLIYVGGEPHYLHVDAFGTSVTTPISVPTEELEAIEDEEEEMADMEELLEQGEKIKERLDVMKNKRMNPKLIKHCLDKQYPSFIEIAKIDDLREMTRFDPEDLQELAIYYPEAAGVLIKDLLTEVYFKGIQAMKQRQSVAKPKTEAVDETQAALKLVSA